MLSDKKCINKYLKGNMEGFDMLYDRYHRQLYTFLYRLMPQYSHLVDDIYQRTWIKAIDNFECYKDKGKFLSWLFKIAHNLFIDYTRKIREDLIEIDFKLKTEYSPYKKIEAKELNSALKESLTKLPMEQREVFLMRTNDIPFKEIAIIQNVNINTALGRMKYAVEKLQKLLHEHL